MDFSKNYYGILGLTNQASQKEIKKNYYKLSFKHHPDKGGDANLFSQITEAYDCLCSDEKKEYDKKSRWGRNYDEIYELLDYDFEGIKESWDVEKIKKLKKNNQLDILVTVDDKFDGTVSYERFLTCKKCGGTGKDLSSKIIIKDENGNILKIFEGNDGCDYCEGSGKNPFGQECGVCAGKGKVGTQNCKTCDGERRILGNQTIKGIKLHSEDEITKVEYMGHVSKEGKGLVGHLYIKNSKQKFPN